MSDEYSIDGLRKMAELPLLLGPDHKTLEANRIFKNVCLQALRLELKVKALTEPHPEE